MEVFVFILVIVALIVVHEFGHFAAAKLSGMRVDEFGIGYPPRALTVAKVDETSYTLNWLPFGGFVKIYGEDPATTTAQTRLATGQAADPRAFSGKNRFLQALVLVAGVAMNLLFAYLLITGALVAGTPRALMPSEVAGARDLALTVASVLPGTPAARAGLVPGDALISARDAAGTWRASDPESFSAFVAESNGHDIRLTIRRSGLERTLTAAPETGIVPGAPARYALGVEVAPVGVVPLSLGKALAEGLTLTGGAIALTAAGLWHFFSGVFTLSANLSQVAGPVGIAGAVGTASAQGLGDLLSLMAVISINLALINLIPIPALDGGRLLFVAIESAIRRPIAPEVARAVNAAGFALLILLMAVVTFHDIYRIVG